MRPLTAAWMTFGLLMARSLVAAGPAADSPAPKIEPEVRQAIDKWVAQDGGKLPEGLDPQPILDPALARLFPKHKFYGLIFPPFPVARIAPAGLKSHNIFVLDADGKVQNLVNKDDLQDFFRKQLPVVADNLSAKAAVRSWLLLSETLAGDGWFKFKIDDDSIVLTASKGSLTAAGKAAVAGGHADRGQIAATLTFDPDGKLTGVKQEVNLKPGPRPICQSTKLLEPDPIVRRMAEDSLRVMGHDAKAYLDEQRAKATPELQQAIDRIWQEIVERERD